MPNILPDYLKVSAADLAQGHTVRITVVPDMAAIAEHMARSIANLVREKPDATLILPVGPVDQFPVLAELCNAERLSLADVVIINMDEYLTADGEWVPIDHPLSFRGFMNRKFYDLLDPELAPPQENRIFPDPRELEAVPRIIAERGGVDACYGGIGINGHLAFNEPPEPGESVSAEEFADRPTRVLELSRETRTINANTVGGSLDVVPRRCVTVGMREILGAKRLRFYCNRPWQSAVARKVLFGPVSAECPASLMRTHSDAELVISEIVAAPPVVALR